MGYLPMNHILAVQRKKSTQGTEEKEDEVHRTKCRCSALRKETTAEYIPKSSKMPQNKSSCPLFANLFQEKTPHSTPTNGNHTTGWFSTATNTNASTIQNNTQTAKEITSTVLKTSGAFQNDGCQNSTGYPEKHFISTLKNANFVTTTKVIY